MPTGTDVTTGDDILAAKMNLKLETVDDDDLDHAVASTASYTIGVDGTGQGFILYSDVEGDDMRWVPATPALKLDDDVHLEFGDASDLLAYWDEAKLEILPATDDTGGIYFGSASKSVDLKWFSDAKFVLLDRGAAKVQLDDIDLYLGDNDVLIFGDGSDLTFYWDGDQFVAIPATDDTGAIHFGDATKSLDLKWFSGDNYILFNRGDFKIQASGSHLVMDTLDDDKQLRINSRDYTQISGDTMALQLKPSQAATTTGDIFGAQISPRIQESYGAGSLQGLGINCDLKGAAGGNVTTLRGISVELESASGSTRTITNATVVRGRNYLHGTVTNGPYMLQVDTHEGNVAWGAFAKLCDDGGNIADLATGVTGNPTGAIKVKIGDTVGYIPIYVGYTAA